MNPTDFAFLIVAILLLSTVVAGSLSSRFGLPAMIGFLALGMIAGSDGPGGIAFSDYGLAQTIGVACLIFILFSGGLDTDWKLVRPVIPRSMDVPDIHWLPVSMYYPEYFIQNGILAQPPQPELPPPPEPELYNLADDPGESRNLATEQPHIARRLLADLENWFAEVEAERRTIRD